MGSVCKYTNITLNSKLLIRIELVKVVTRMIHSPDVEIQKRV